MNDTHKTKRQLLEGLADSHRLIAQLEKKVSAYKKIENARLKSEQMLGLFIENAPAAIAMFDSDMRYIAVSRRWLSDYGLGDQDIIGRTHYEVFPEIPERWKNIHQRALAGEPQRCEEDPFPRLDGRTDWVRWEILPWRESNEHISGIIMFTEVITERKQMEEALRRDEEQFRLAIEDAPIPIIMHTEDGEVLQISRTWTELTGYTLQNMQTFNGWLSLASGEGAETVHSHVQELFKGSPRMINVEFPIRTRDGSVRHWSFNTSSPGTLRDGRRFIVGMATDITERIKMDEELKVYRDRLETLVAKRTAELEERNRKLNEEITERWKAETEKRKMESQLAQTQRIEALDRFAGGIAHDLNNILYPILINIEELLAETPVDSSRHELLTQTMKAVIRQKDLVKKILSFGRRSEEEPRPVKVAPLVEETMDFLRSTLPSTIDIKQQIDAQTDMIMGDPTQIQQVVMNLVQNAADSLGSQKGTIEVRLTTTHLEPVRTNREMKPGDYLELTVKDTGSGIAPEVLDHIFEPFYTTKGFGRGSGMGLSVVHGIVKRLGGAITVRSRPGEGTLFTVYLPLYVGKTYAQTSTPETGPSEKCREKILLVDDEELILSSLQRVLKMSGYRVVAVRDSAEALRLFEREPYEYDLIVTDLTMPKMTGVELTRKALETRPDIPVVLCTGFNDVINEQEAKSLGIRELLLKPADSRELKKIVRRALEH